MKKLNFYNMLNSMEDKEFIEKFLIYSASLVIAGVKPSATVSLSKTKGNLYSKWIKYGIDFMKKINTKYIELRETDNTLILLVYNEENIKDCIFADNNKEFLMNLGYSNDENLSEYLDMLKSRYELYNCPHELGVFLGFPLEDVKDFIECTNKKCFNCKYWRVYNNYNKAIEIVNNYDNIRDYTLENILQGYKSYEITQNIRMFINSNINISA